MRESPSMRAHAVTLFVCIALLMPACASRDSLSLRNEGDTRVHADIAMPWRAYLPFEETRHYTVTLAPGEEWSTRDASPEDTTRFDIQPSGRAVVRIRNASLSSPTTREYLIDLASNAHASITIDAISAFLTRSEGPPLELTPNDHRWFHE